MRGLCFARRQRAMRQRPRLDGARKFALRARYGFRAACRRHMLLGRGCRRFGGAICGDASTNTRAARMTIAAAMRAGKPHDVCRLLPSRHRSRPATAKSFAFSIGPTAGPLENDRCCSPKLEWNDQCAASQTIRQRGCRLHCAQRECRGSEACKNIIWSARMRRLLRMKPSLRHTAYGT